MRLEDSLVLNRYLHHLLGADHLSDLSAVLQAVRGGRDVDGQSHWFHALAGRRSLRIEPDVLRRYDARVLALEERLRHARGGFALKYFQYLALLYAELYLDRLTSDPDALGAELNAFARDASRSGVAAPRVAFTTADLRRIAFFMATGSGKTLLLHATLWQVLDYLEHGRHPEALVERADGRREFDGIYLVTPNEGLSRQHIEEARLSGIVAEPLGPRPADLGLLGPRLRVTEITKLVEVPSKDGVGVLLDELAGCNLVFVDEGHKGTGSDAQTWKRRQRRLSQDGFIVEYSATFAQAIASAPLAGRADLIDEYGRSIVFDYSYAHFYEDGYGKDFRVLNLRRGREARAHELLVGALLSFYQQARLYRDTGDALRPFNLEAPLWVFLGSSVSRESRQGHSDVASVLTFLRRFLDDAGWATETIATWVEERTGFIDDDTGSDLLSGRLTHLGSRDPRALYDAIRALLFHGTGTLDVREIKQADGEFGLRVASGADPVYFGVVSVGDAREFRRHIETLGFAVADDQFSGSLFESVNAPGSSVTVLVGAKRFIEGWSSWRVSTMGLLNMGRGEGPQVIQLFGRGVRLKGEDWSLQRSGAMAERSPRPVGLTELETLSIFGWNSDYVQTFRSVLEREELMRSTFVPVVANGTLWEVLPVPQPQGGYRTDLETWTLDESRPGIRIDLAPSVTALEAEREWRAQAGAPEVDFTDPRILNLLDADALWIDLQEAKDRSGRGNVHVPRAVVPVILSQALVRMPSEDQRDPELLQAAARDVLVRYLESWARHRERTTESEHLAPVGLGTLRETIPPGYTVRTSSDDLFERIRGLVARPSDLLADGGEPLPRLHIDGHIYDPLLLAPSGARTQAIRLSPPGLNEDEARLLRDLRSYWAANHASAAFAATEVHILRNLPSVGVGFFRSSGFYPDFILWMRDRTTGLVRVTFLEPHGLHHGGIAGVEDKIASLRALAETSRRGEFAGAGIRLDGYLLTTTELQHIADRGARSWDDLQRECLILRQVGQYVERIFSTAP